MEVFTKDQIHQLKGRKAVIREITRLDKQRLLDGISEMSADSIYNRFFAAKRGFSGKELNDLTDFDPTLHYAIGAADYSDHSKSMGSARFVHSKDDPNAAEFAVTIIDKYQGIGLGKELLSMLIEEAKRRGITSLYGDLLINNESMIGLARSMTKTHNCSLKLSPAEQGIQTLTLKFN